jgi:hypothetical protein
MATKTESRVSDLFEQAASTFGDALKAGVKIQEEVGKFWTDTLDQCPVQEWQKKSRAIVSETIPAARKNAEQWLKAVEENYRRSLALLKKAFDGEQANPKDFASKTQQLWQETLELVRDNTQAITQANVKILELWADLLRGVDGAKAATKK